MAPIVAVEHPVVRKGFYQIVIDWALEHAPEAAAQLEVQDLSQGVRGGPSVRLLVPWLQDPIVDWSRPIYDYMLRVQAQFDQRAIPVINRVEHLANAGKTAATALIASAGLRTAPTALITDVEGFLRDFGGLAFPFFVREDWGHGSEMRRVETPGEARALDFGAWARPAATQVIDVRDPRDGLHHKYRYFACAEHGVSQHVQCSEDWITRGFNRVGTEATRQEEMDYVSQPDPHHARFQAARRALRLDMVAFDYGYDRDGEVVVWEANPLPHIVFGQKKTAYRNRAIDRSLAAMWAMYLERAGLPVPPAISAFLRYD